MLKAAGVTYTVAHLTPLAPALVAADITVGALAGVGLASYGAYKYSKYRGNKANAKRNLVFSTTTNKTGPDLEDYLFRQAQRACWLEARATGARSAGGQANFNPIGSAGYASDSAFQYAIPVNRPNLIVNNEDGVIKAASGNISFSKNYERISSQLGHKTQYVFQVDDCRPGKMRLPRESFFGGAEDLDDDEDDEGNYGNTQQRYVSSRTNKYPSGGRSGDNDFSDETDGSNYSPYGSSSSRKAH
jgi:hypothetical protein